MKAGLYKKFAGVVAVALVAAMPVMAAATSTPISNLIVRPQGDFVELTVIGGGRVMCENFTEPAENGRPFRIVLDFCDADHALGQQTFDALPMTQIKRIRTSQYATDPQHVVRVVLDMREEVTYTTRDAGSSLVVRFVDPNRKFATWEANPNGPGTMATNSAPTMAVNTPAPAKTPVKPEAKPPVKTEPAPVMVQTTPPPAVTTPTKTITAEVSHKSAPTHSPSMAMVPTESNPLAEHERPKAQTQVVVGAMPEPAAAPPTQHASVTPEKKSTGTTTPSTVKNEEAVVAQTPTTTPVTKTSSPVPAASTANTPAANFATGAHPYEVPQVPLVFAPEYLDGTKPMPDGAPAPPRDFAVSKESLTPVGPPEPSPGQQTSVETEAVKAMWASTTGPSLKGQRQPVSHDNKTDAAASSDEDTEVQPSGTLLDRLKTKFFGNQTAPRPYTTVDPEGLPGAEPYGPPTPSNDLDREALLERIRQTEQRVAAGESGHNATEDEEGAGGIPTRTMLYYDDMGRRDPFAPLVTGLRSGFVTDQLPVIETLRLVGVLHDDVEALALLENVEGYSYIMRSGDKVQNGSLVAVQGNRALFRVDDYGWSHVVALQLTPRGSDPSKALGLSHRQYPKHDDDDQNQKQKSDATDNQGSDGE